MTSIEIVDGFVVVLGALSFLMNAVNLATLWYNNCEQIFRRSMSYMVACLAIADLLTGANSVLWGIRNVTGFYPQTILFTIYWTTVEVSFLTIVAMALDRFIAVTYPTHSESIVSPQRTLIGCAFIWIVSALIGTLILYHLDEGKFVFCALFELNIVGVTVLYILMYRKARVISKLAHSGEMRDKHAIRKATLESRVYVVVLVLVGVLVVTVLPYILALHIELGIIITSPESERNSALDAFLTYYLPVELLNFLVNPIVYAWRLPKYRKALWRTLTFSSK